MTKQIGIRELVRDTSILDRYDIIEIEDKKTKTPKGMFVSQKYADGVKAFIKRQEQNKKEERLKRFMEFVGKITIDERFIDKEIFNKEDRYIVAKRKLGE